MRQFQHLPPEVKPKSTIISELYHRATAHRRLSIIFLRWKARTRLRKCLEVRHTRLRNCLLNRVSHGSCRLDRNVAISQSCTRGPVEQVEAVEFASRWEPFGPSELRVYRSDDQKAGSKYGTLRSAPEARVPHERRSVECPRPEIELLSSRVS